MKKLLIVLAALLILCGCSSKNSTAAVSGGDEVVFTGPGTSFTKADLNEVIKSNDYTSIIMPEIIKMIAENEDVDLEAIEKDADAYIAEMEAQGMGAYITYYYGSNELFKANFIANGVISEMNSRVIENGFDAYVSEYLPYKAEIAYFDMIEAAEDVLKDVADGATFAYASNNRGYNSEITETVYTDHDDQPIEVKEAIINAEGCGILGPVEVITYTKDTDGNQQTNSRYYLINLLSDNVADFKDEFVAKVMEDIDSEQTISDMLKNHNVKLYDQRTYELLSESYEALK